MYNKRKKRRILTLTICTILILNIFFLYLSVKNTVKSDYLAIRSTPNLQTSLQELVLKGEKMTILKKQNDWTQIFTNNHTGWVLTDDLESEIVNVSNSASLVKPIKSGISVYKDHRSTDKEIGKLDTNTTYLKYYEKNNWSQIVYNQSVAWVESDLLTSAHSEENQQTVKKQYPSVNLVKVKTETPLLSQASGGSTLGNLLIGDELIVADSKVSNNHYYGTLTSEDLQGFVNSNAVTYKENVTQRIGTQAKQINQAKIVIDAGHGGVDGGALDSTKQVSEKEVTLKTADTLKKVLETAGAKVIMVRENDNDVDLSKRSDVANRENADVFISLHYDSSEQTGPSGTSVHYLHYEDTLLADLLESELRKLPLKSNGKKVSNFVVLRESKSPAVLLELGYMNNTSDVNIFNSDAYREQVSQHILKALQHYFSN
ncbi:MULTISPECIES: N-acetylmuramoyl-L-alanine amidase [unclassified Granulicatella]|uniref:N-acetylmuramoyl-L-alanine amidase n=1 Tax=unclassified Granulicatella TaxID=2630493 RepID=UPI001073410D|nr:MULTISPECIES: N-acetylmuramoyl-L-alanine amidase [unclassified Granulicatella]MBF0779918.1 N-acetylmuramoyl-L-alanine amidase [Granulicatella sp. 19428wC4_WM01]TFU96029.1 hypothetical protein E4T68_02300 [Granulicatella sp. WM01]